MARVTVHPVPAACVAPQTSTRLQMMRSMMGSIGRAVGYYLSQPVSNYRPLTTSTASILAQTLRPGDVLLVEGNTRVSSAIKYLTQSTWSHAALYVGDALGGAAAGAEQLDLIEVDMVEGVCAVPLSNYATLHTRVCRPAALRPEDVPRVIAYAISRLGHTYDLKNLIDLARYFLPLPALPSRWRRCMLALGSGDPTKAICSSLIAQAFQSVGYPILPAMRRRHSDPGAEDHNRGILTIQHFSQYTPRDFDISPYFEVVKPTVQHGFEYRAVASSVTGSGHATVPASHALPVAEPVFSARDARAALAA
jgi:hypothetical protein